MAPSPDERDRLADERDQRADERDRQADERERQADERDREAADDERPEEPEAVSGGDLYGIEFGKAGGKAEESEPDETPKPAPAAPRTLTERLAAAAADKHPPASS